MGVFRQIFNLWFRSSNEVLDRNRELLVKSGDSPMGWNIYVAPNTTRNEFAKEFGRVHKSFKYKFLVPCLLIARKFFLPKYKHEGAVLDVPFNREWVVFERAWNLAMEDLVTIYRYSPNQANGVSNDEAVRALRDDPEVWWTLKTLKQGALYVPMMDTAYHEFGTFFMHRVYQEMAKEFNGQEYNRVVYDSRSISDPCWYITQRAVNNVNPSDGSIGLKMVKIRGGGVKWDDLKKTE